MFIFRSPRTGTGLVALAAIMLLLALNLGGCSDNTESPTQAEVATAPNLPAAEQFSFDFSFFDAGSQLDKSGGEYENFVNAYLRTVVLEAMAHLVLAAPVGTFAAALNTVPVVQEDGSWVWSYDWQYGPDPIRVSLRGMPAGDVVQWEMMLSPVGSEWSVLWFSGTTTGNGAEGRWEFYDLDTEGHPVSGEIVWGQGAHGDYLEFVSREPDSMGNTLRFSNKDPDFMIEFTPGDGSGFSFIRWHAMGSGSLQVPDYNNGLEACWDVYQRNIDCR